MTTLVRQGKVRDVYDIGAHYLMVASDRISAFDYVLPTRIPDKGRVLTQISKFWFDYFDVPHHLVSTDVTSVELPEGLTAEELEGRTMIVKNAKSFRSSVWFVGIWSDLAGEIINRPAQFVESNWLPTSRIAPSSQVHFSRPPQRQKPGTTKTFRSSK